MIFANNNKIRKKLLKAVCGLTDEQFNKQPHPSGWSPKQLFEHLVLMETLIANSIAKELNNPESKRAFRKPIFLSSNRMIKVEAPGKTSPTEEFKTISQMKEELHNSRLYLLDIYESGTKELFQTKSFKHPIFGCIPLIQWFPFVGLHEKRHVKQLKNTIKLL